MKGRKCVRKALRKAHCFKKRRKKKRRVARADCDALIPAAPSGYVACPHSAVFSFIDLKVCRHNHFFWNRDVLGIGARSAFSERYCKNCTMWKRYVPPELRALNRKNVRTVFLAPLPKYKRIRRPYIPKKLKRTRTFSLF